MSSPQLSVSGLYNASPDPVTPGKRIQPLFNPPVERRQLRLHVSCRRTVQRHRHPAFRLISEMLVLQLIETSRRHGGARNQHHRNGGLYDQQRLASQGRVIARAPARAAQCFQRTRSRGKPGGRRAKKDPRRQRHRKGERQHHRRRYRADGDEMGTSKRQAKQKTPGHDRDGESRNSPRERKQDRFHQRLPDDLPAAGPHRQA